MLQEQGPTGKIKEAVDLLQRASTSIRSEHRDLVSISWLDDDGEEIGCGDFGNPNMAASPRSCARINGLGEFDGVEADMLARHMEVFRN